MEMMQKDRRKLRWLQETVSTLVIENNYGKECTKDRIQYFQENKFDKTAYEVIHIDNIPDDIDRKKIEYYGKHLWVVVNELPQIL